MMMTALSSMRLSVAIFFVSLLLLLLLLAVPVASFVIQHHHHHVVQSSAPTISGRHMKQQIPTQAVSSRCQYYPLLDACRQQSRKPKTTTTILLHSQTSNELDNRGEEDSLTEEAPPPPPPTTTKTTPGSVGYTLSLVCSVISWMSISYVALSKHPTPAVHAVTSVRHNCFTIAQAIAFPIPVLVGSFLEVMNLESLPPPPPTKTQSSSSSNSSSFRRLNLGIAVASLWSAAAVVWCKRFSVGYDLFSSQPIPIRVGIPVIQTLVALYCLWKWKESLVQTDMPSSSTDKNKRPFSYYVSRLVNGCIESFYSLLSPPSKNIKAQCYALSTKCLFVLAMLPQLVCFPTANIPTLLGKRLSRAASGYTWLGAVGLLCLYDEQQQQDDSDSTTTTNSLRYLLRGLRLGSLLHISLVWSKIIGFDGGGLLLPGRGLWNDYPSLVNASLGVKCLMMITYPLIVYATTTTRTTTSSMENKAS